MESVQNNGGVLQVNENHEFEIDGVKAELNMKLFELGNLKSVYNPDLFSPEILSSNKADWTGEVKAVHTGLMKFVSTNMVKPETSQDDKVVLGDVLKAANTQFSEFLRDFTQKCTVGGGAPPNNTGAPPQPVHNSSASSNENSIQSQAAEKARLADVEVGVTVEKINDIAKTLSKEFKRFDDWSKAPSHNIEEAMKGISDWNRRLEVVKDKFWEIKTKTISHNLNRTRMTQSESVVNTVIAEADVVISKIEHEDKERCLYSLNKSNTAPIKYNKFEGNFKEDYLRWEKETKTALVQNKVRLEDQVKVIRENLLGHALKLIPVSMTNPDTVFSTLSTIFGDTSKVMEVKRDKLTSMGQFPNGKVKSAGYVQTQVEWLLTVETLFTDLFDLADLSEDLNRSIFNPDFYKEVLDLFPLEVYTLMSKVKGDSQTKFEGLAAFVKEKREEQQEVLKGLLKRAPKNVEKDKFKNKNEKNGDKGIQNANITFKPAQRFEDCRVCQKLDSEGSTENLYDAHTNDCASGCPVFVSLPTSQRLKYAKKARLCLYCLDSKFVYKGPGSRHVNCIVFKKKCFFTCQESTCKIHFLLCTEHISQNKEKLDQTRQFWENKGNQFATSFVMNTPNQSQSEETENRGSVSEPPQVTTPVVTIEDSPPRSQSSGLQSLSVPPPARSPELDKENIPPPPVNTSVNVRMSEAAEKLRQEAGADVIVHPLPEGDPLFMFSSAVGKTRSLNVFYDSGASHLMVKEEAIQELQAVMVQKGPLAINAAGDTVVRVNDEYLITMEKLDGSRQIMIGVTADTLTSEFPQIPTKEAHREIILNTPKHKRSRVNQLKVPETAGGSIDILLGTFYRACFPEIIHQLPSGLFIAKLRLKTHDGASTACIGGPHKTFTAMMNQCGDVSNLISVFISGLKDFRSLGPPKIKAPMMTFEDIDLAVKLNKSETIDLVGDPDEAKEDETEIDVPDVDSDPAAESNMVSTAGFTLQCSSCARDVMEEPKDVINALKDDLGVDKIKKYSVFNSIGPDKSLNDLKTIIKIMEQGLDIQYRCPKCRECWGCKSGPTTERVSLREEQEDDAIKDSVKIDFSKKEISAALPLRGDPAQHLAPNRHIAAKVLDQQCRKVQDDDETKAMVIKSFAKLTDNGYAVEFRKLTPEQKRKILTKEPQLYFPWRIQFKDSISTPARCVMDGSSKTPLLENGVGGRCLNDICMKGTVSTLNLIKMLLRFSVGSTAICGDIRQFYNRIKLVEDQWHLQRILFKPNMDIEAETKEYIIVSLIYGVRSVSALSERAVLDLAESVSNTNPRLAEFITEARFCDDVADSDKSKEIIVNVKDDADKLFESAGLECKGWSVTGEDPHPEVTSDGVHVDVGGLVWAPRVDAIGIKIPPLHFGKKMRGRLKVGTEVFEGTMLSDMEKFVPKKLTRRIITSKFSSLFDPLGKLVPLTSSMKVHLRKVVKQTIGWDDQVFSDLRQTWVENLWKLFKLQGMKFNRAVIPEDAVDTKLELYVCVDAAEVKVAGIWGRFKRRNGTYSCQLIIGRSLLATQDSTIPKQELESIVIGCNLLWIVKDSLKNWVSDYKVFSDSAISLCWTTNQSKRLSIFHRNRVIQILLNCDINKLYFLRGEFNPSDNGTRADKVTEDSVGPESPWEKGLEWMKEPLEKAIDEDIVKPASELKLVDKEEEEYDKGFIIEKDLEVLVRGHYIENVDKETVSAHLVHLNTQRVEKFRDRAFFARYIFLPTFSFDKVIRITSLCYKFIRKCAEKAKMSKMLSDVSKQASLLPTPVKSQFVGLSWVTDNVGDDDSAENQVIDIDEVDVERSLVYWFSKATREVKSFNSTAYINKVGVEKEGILFCRSRIIDGQRLIQAAEFSADSLGKEIDLNLLTPLIDRHSPIALSISLYIHQNVAKHAGAETCYRLSLSYCHILQGASLFRELGTECVKCRIVRKKYLEVAMSPVSDHQLSMAGAWNVAYLDLDGPYSVSVPGFERETRGRRCLATKCWIMLFCDPISKLVNLQVIEAKNTQAVMEGITRLGCECGFPSVLVMDKETSLVKMAEKAKVNLHDLSLRVYKEHGIKFETAPVAAHNFNGLCERKIRTAQDCFKRIDLQSQKLHSTGLQTFAKLVENQMNNLPLGFSYENSSNNTPLLKIITPNMLRLGRLNSRALQGPLRLPTGPKEVMSKVTMLYDAFYKVWNISMVPRLIPQPKWFKSSEELKVDDVVYFQKIENDISSNWSIGQVDSVVRGKDGVIRRVNVRYFNHGQKKPRFTERSVRSLVRLFNIEDDYFVDDISEVERLFKQMKLTPDLDNTDTNVPEESEDAIEKEDEACDNDVPIRAVANVKLICKCCCPAHCSLSHHSVTGRVSGISLSALYASAIPFQCPAPAYTKENVSRADFTIASNGFVDTLVKDELYATITALETQFDLE